MGVHHRRFCAGLGFALTLVWLGAPAARADALPQVVQEVLARHPDIRASQALLRAAQERILQSRSNLFPTVGFDMIAAGTRERELLRGDRERTSRHADLFLRWNLWPDLTDRHALRMAEGDSRAASADLADAHETVAAQVATVFFEVWRLRQRVELAEHFVRDTARLAREVGQRVDAGRAPAVEIQQARLSEIEAQRQVAQLRGQLAAAEAEFEWLVGRAAPTTLAAPALEASLATITGEDLLDRLARDNQRVRAAQLRAQARAEEVGVVRAEQAPTLAFEVRTRVHSRAEPPALSETRDSVQFRLSYLVPLGGGSFSREREAAARMEAARATADAVLLQARVSWEQVWHPYEQNLRLVQSLAESVLAGEQVVAAHDLQFVAGRRSLQDLIAVRAELLRTRADLIDNQADRMLGAAQLLSLLGALVPTLQAQ